MECEKGMEKDWTMKNPASLCLLPLQPSIYSFSDTYSQRNHHSNIEELFCYRIHTAILNQSLLPESLPE